MTEQTHPSRRRWILGAVALLLLGGGYEGWRAAHATSPPRFETVPVEKGTLVAKVTSTGTLSALVTVQVGTQVSGRVQTLYVDWNSAVKKGQRIAKIDPQLYDAAVEQARASYLAAQGNLEQARAKAMDAARQYTRERALMEKSLVAQADLDTSQANADAAQAGVTQANGQLAQAKANLHQAEVNLQYTDIIAPTDGTIISRNVDPGQTVAASLQAPVLFTIAQDLRKMQVDTSVPEADVGKLSAGMEATFTVDAYPSERFKGTIRQIRNAAQTVQNVVTYDAVIDVDNGDLKLRPGMTANVTVVYAQKQDVLRVPNAALRFKPPPDVLAAPRGPGGGASPRDPPPSDQKAVWVLKGTAPERLKVRVGISDGTTSEIVDGDLKQGDLVITDVSGSGNTTQGPPGGVRPRMF